MIGLGLGTLAIGWLIPWGTGPTHEGKSAREWVNALARADGRLSENIAALQSLGADAIPELTRLLNCKETIWRSLYARWASSMPSVLGRRLPAPGVEPHDARTRAAAVLGRLRLPEAVGPLLEALDDSSAQVRHEVVSSLGYFGPASEGLIVPALIKALDDPDLSVRQNACMTLGTFAARAPGALPRLRELALEGDADLRAYAVQALVTARLEQESARRAREEIVIQDRPVQLGNPARPEWTVDAGAISGPEGKFDFVIPKVNGDMTLLLSQSDVKHEWRIGLNGRRIGLLQQNEAALRQAVAVEAEFLQEGSNTLTILPSQPDDTIILGEIVLVTRSKRELLSEATLTVDVTDLGDGQSIPCRITITDSIGILAPLHTDPADRLAVRTGVIYTANGKARTQLRAGDYVVYASRGFEYSVSTQRVSVAVGEAKSIAMRIEREVSTPNMIACDTHVHSLTHSGHGDATIHERVCALAGEGIELPIATEHNVHVSYVKPAGDAGVLKYFTPVVGNEVTTKSGHFNVFPVQPGSTPPDWKIEHWPTLMESIRRTPDVQVVILNHPRDLHSNFRPFAETNYMSVTGENLRGFEFGFDAVEIVNSGALRSDLMQVYRDWFGLLNYGYRITGVAGSDSHDVSRYIVGQGRTYIRVDSDDPGRIDVGEACRALREGRASISMGLLVTMSVIGKFWPGDLATLPKGPAGETEVQIKVLGPSWVEVDRVEIFANGIQVHERRISALTTDRRFLQKGEKAIVRWIMPPMGHDVHLVAIASGPGVRAPYWPIPKPYQPSSPDWEPRVIGSAGPIWLDADSDGEFTAARRYAESLLKKHGTDFAGLMSALAAYDEAVAAQAASLCDKAGVPLDGTEFRRALERAGKTVQNSFRAYQSARLLSRPN